MSITDLGNITSGGTTYDFTKMTNQQLLKAGGQLLSEGKITEQDSANLMGLVCDVAPVSGQMLANEGLNSSIPRNFMQIVQQNITELQSIGGGDAAMQKALSSDQDLLQAMKEYQTQSAASTSQDSTPSLFSQQV